VLRRRAAGEARFRLPAGPALAAMGIGVCMVFLTAMQRSSFYVLAIVALVALLNWLWASRRVRLPVE
jgi:hypothetical protein